MKHDHSEHAEEALLNQGAGLTTARIETLSDSVFAIAMTLLVLDFVVPANLGVGGLRQALYQLWPTFVAYLLSFVALGTLWVGHHHQFYWIKFSNRRFLWINIFFLMFVVLVPFSTTILGRYRHEKLAIFMYGLNLIFCALLLFVQWSYAAKGHRLVAQNLSHRLISIIKARILIGLGLYVVALALAFLSTGVSIAIFVFAQVLAIAPSQTDKIIMFELG